ncbi:MAG: tRNA (adenosine(37)-N6)-threonylcarbamoyltransferase complex dimerization subunit type 1 TsaB [Ferrimicrobium sp.]
MSQPGAVLAIDTRGRVVRVAASQGEEVVFDGCGIVERRPLAELMPLVCDALSTLDVPVVALGVIVGPGGFLALRAGVAFVRAYAGVRGISTVALSTFAAVAWSLGPIDTPVVVVEPAGRGEVAAAKYSHGALVGEIVITTPSELVIPAGFCLAGSAANSVPLVDGVALSGVEWPSGEGLCRLTRSAVRRGEGVPASELTPYYLRSVSVRRSFEVRRTDGRVVKVDEA